MKARHAWPFVAICAIGVLVATGFAQQEDSAVRQPGRQEENYRSPGDRHKVEVTPLEAVKLQGREVGSYGERVIVEIGTDQLRALELAGNTLNVKDDYNLILLNSGHIDTSVYSKSAKPEASRSAAAAGPGLRLVHFAGPIQPEWYEELERTGVDVIQYIPNNAYLVFGGAAELDRLSAFSRARAFVQWEGEYAERFKYPTPEMAEQMMKIAATRVEEFRRAGQPSSKERSAAALPAYTVQLVAPGSAETLSLIEKYKGAAYINDYSILKYRNITLNLDELGAKLIAGQPDVIVVEPYRAPSKMDERQNVIMSGQLSGSGPQTGIDWLSYLAAKGFSLSTPSTFVVDVADSGVDNGTTNPNHFALHTLGTFGASRVVYARLEGTPNSGSTIQGLDGHGNLNSHIVAGYVPTGSLNGVNYALAPHTDASGFRYGIGVAPFVRVGSSVIFDPNNFTNPSYPNMASRAYNSGARISTNSWGANVGGAYTTDAQAYDALVRDAQPTGSAFAAAGNQEMVYFFSAGNAGSAANTIGSPGTAKNVITVGAAENVHPFGAADQCGAADSAADSANDIAYFSSRGPTDDGRVKPDIQAPGTHVSGGVAQASQIYTGPGAAIAGFTAGGVCAGPGASDFWPLGYQWTTASSGTSHSTPATAGVGALIRQHFINLGQPVPSPALTKALLTNSARYMTGLSANDNLFSNSQGMGMVATESYFAMMAGQKLLVDQAETFTGSGQTRVYTGTIADSGKPFRVTLAWTDAPGSTTGNAFVNNLDLEVTLNGVPYKGNVFSGANSATGGSADPRNNLESVFFPAGTAGTISITVRATNIAGDGVPGNATPLDQDFALVAANLTTVPMPVVVTTGTTVTSRGCVAALSVMDPGETVTVGLTLKNVGTAATTNTIATLQASGGVLNPSAAQSYGAMNPGDSATRSFTFTVNSSLPCGNAVTQTYTIANGSSSLGTVSNSSLTGAPVVIASQNFDGVTIPALPAGWTAACTGTGCSGGTSGSPALTRGPWATYANAGRADSGANAAAAADAPAVSDNTLTSPAFVPTSLGSTVSFRHWYDLEYSLSTAWDGGVLEISINGGAFQDILAAGGSFLAGGYTGTVSSSFSNPLGGRQAWTNNAGGFITTTVALPASAINQSVQLRWRLGTDTTVADNGWYVDTFTVNSGVSCCTPPPPPAVAPNLNYLISGSGPRVGTTLPVALTLQNLSSGQAQNVKITSLVASRLLGTGTVSVATATPINLGNVAANASVPVNITLTSAATVTRIRLAVTTQYLDPSSSTTKTVTQYLTFFPPAVPASVSEPRPVSEELD